MVSITYIMCCCVPYKNDAFGRKLSLKIILQLTSSHKTDSVCTHLCGVVAELCFITALTLL